MIKKLSLVILLLAGPSSALALSLTVNSGGIAIIDTGGGDDLVEMTSRGTDLLVTINGSEQDPLHNVKGLRLHTLRGNNTVIMDRVNFQNKVLFRNAGNRLNVQRTTITNSNFGGDVVYTSGHSDDLFVIRNSTVKGLLGIAPGGKSALIEIDGVTAAELSTGVGPWGSREFPFQSDIANWAFIGKEYKNGSGVIRVNNTRVLKWMHLGFGDGSFAQAEITSSEIHNFKFIERGVSHQLILSGNTFTGRSHLQFSLSEFNRPNSVDRLYTGIPNWHEFLITWGLHSDEGILIGEE